MRERVPTGKRKRKRVKIASLTVLAVSLTLLATAWHVSQPVQTASTPAPTAPQSPFLSGVIEGFYGPSWSVPDTLQMMSFIHARKMNTFLYAPKYDPYERAQWSELYPPSAFAPLREIVAGALHNDVQFVYSISPGLSITYSSRRDRQLLLAKIAQLQSIGVHSFMLSFDDIGESLDAQDQRVYHGNLAQAEAALADYVYETEQRRDPHFRLLLAQTVYYGTTDNAFWDSLKKYLLPAITPIWTGAWVLNNQITAQQVRMVEADMGHRVLIWDNYPVNDFTYVVAKRPELFLGPVVGRDPLLPSLVAGYLFNPMYQSRASEIPLWTGAAYLRDPQHYQPLVSWQHALHAIGGPAWPALTLFAQANSSYYYDNTQPPALESAIAAFWHSKPMGTSVRNSALYIQLAQLATVNAQLKAGLPDRALYAQIAPFAEVLSQQAQVGLRALADWTADRGGTLTAVQARVLQGEIKKLSESSLTVASGGILAFLQQFAARTH